MSILVKFEDSTESSPNFDFENDWFIGRNILVDNQPESLANVFQLQTVNSIDRSERLESLTKKFFEKPTRSCFDDVFLSTDEQSSSRNSKLLESTEKSTRIIPSQNILFELAQEKPDSNRFTLNFYDEKLINSDDDGFQSASSSVSEENSSIELDLWTHALNQKENHYFTWEQRGSYLYQRTRPFLFDIRDDDRAFQHFCLISLLKKPMIDRPFDIQYRPIGVDEFLRDLCYMLMSISSQTFQWNPLDRTFELLADVYVLGYTQQIIHSFSQRYIQAANKFVEIVEYVQRSSKNQSETENIFCQALRYYLRYIQNSLSIEDVKNYSLIKFSAQIQPIICSFDLPLSLVSSIGQLEKTIQTSSPTTSLAFIKLCSILHTLLNQNYHSIDQNYFLLLIHLVVYSLQPLLTFLRNLILHSSYLDRYNEYPILFHENRLTGLKTSEFWTKTFTIRYLHANDTDTIFHQVLPIEYLQQIVNITRSLLLLKLCDRNHPLCSSTNEKKPLLKFVNFNVIDRHYNDELRDYQAAMNDEIQRYERAQKQKRLDIEQAKVQQRMEMYAKQDQLRAERKRLADEVKERLKKEKENLRDEWQVQVDEKQRKLKEEKLAEALADAENNQKATATTTIIGSRLAAPYENLVNNVREEIVAEYDAKMRDANQREEQFRKRTQENPAVESKREETPGSIDLSFHTPAVEPSPMVELKTEEKSVEQSPLVVLKEKNENENNVKASPILPDPVVVRHTATEETTQPEYRPGVKIVPSRVLQSTIQNYLIDHDPNEKVEVEEELAEKVYDWDTIIAHGPQFKYDDDYDFTVKDSLASNVEFARPWLHRDMSPLRVWLANSLSPIIRIQSELVNRALLNYFFDELNLLEHLNNLRAFYFLATGRFGIGFCSELSRILLSDDDARSIYRLNSMRQILYTALDQTGQLTHFIDLVQLTIKPNLPDALTLLDSNLFDYFHLCYAVEWPLNILISEDIFEKYRIIFRFLLRILIVKQVLNEIWLMLKSCKQTNRLVGQLHQYRHQMQHFLTVLINYITNQVIQISWNELMKKIQKAQHINEISAAHHEYLDRTMLNCLLTPNAAPIFNEVNRVLTLIIRFRCQLKTFSWILDASEVDPSDSSGQALRTTFEKYQLAVLSLFKVLSKLVEKGYKTSLADLLIRLNHNGYYDRLASIVRRQH